MFVGKLADHPRKQEMTCHVSFFLTSSKKVLDYRSTTTPLTMLAPPAPKLGHDRCYREAKDEDIYLQGWPFGGAVFPPAFGKPHVKTHEFVWVKRFLFWNWKTSVAWFTATIGMYSLTCSWHPALDSYSWIPLFSRTFVGNSLRCVDEIFIQLKVYGHIFIVKKNTHIFCYFLFKFSPT